MPATALWAAVRSRVVTSPAPADHPAPGSATTGVHVWPIVNRCFCFQNVCSGCKVRGDQNVWGSNPIGKYRALATLSRGLLCSRRWLILQHADRPATTIFFTEWTVFHLQDFTPVAGKFLPLTIDLFCTADSAANRHPSCNNGSCVRRGAA